MNYKSTRGGVANLTFTDAIMMGLATDGGLILPERIPHISEDELERFSKLKYADLAYEIISLFAPEYDKKSLKAIIDKSYSDNFYSKDIIDIYDSKTVKIAELFHGPTFAFKDLALQFLGNLFEDILKRSGEVLNIVGATSGDTGSAAIYGVSGKKNINIFVLYPNNRVSKVQESQITSVLDKNVFSISIDGTFDDCQLIVKSLFNDSAFKKEYNLGAVNSINFARILAQVVYYFYIYFKVNQNNKKSINFVVPTGNFGNIFACFMAKKMGLNIGKIVLATNANNILSRAINYGDYSLSDVVKTYSPSMDIQLASNFERYLYYLFGENSDTLNSALKELDENRRIELKKYLPEISKDFIASDCSNEECAVAIEKFYADNNYLIDPHTACGVAVAIKLGYGDVDMLARRNEDTVCLATAHPAKFYDDIRDKVKGVKFVTPKAIENLYGRTKSITFMKNDIEEMKRFIRIKIDNEKN